MDYSSFECLILILKGISILRDIWDQSWRNFMLIKTTYPNFLHGCDFFLFLAYELLMSLEGIFRDENRSPHATPVG